MMLTGHTSTVILTRLQRVTFLTAHKYLGLTREVIRTEKAINELANYPLPSAFWDTGGTQRLRQRFQPETKIVDESDGATDYFAMDTPYNGPAMGESFWGPVETNAEGVKMRYRTPTRRNSMQKAGDLFSMSSTVDAAPKLERATSTKEFGDASRRSASGVEDFDLREAVMECISKAIGLVQPVATPAASVNASPMFRPQDQNLQKAVFNSSFGSLSFLGMQGFDDDSSVTGSSIASFSSTELENEVEILYFPQGATLVKEGEQNAGLYFVIEGFLDVSMPETSSSPLLKKPTSRSNPPTTPAPSTPLKPQPFRTGSGGDPRSTPIRPPLRFAPGLSGTTPHLPPLSSKPSTDTAKSTSLFTVKPGGIAGYLSSLSGFPSYVDITAKTECYVGFLPAKALERIMDRKPIVLLTLAKRLISLLSPLGQFLRLRLSESG